jgi:uncharacterized protein YjlB
VTAKAEAKFPQPERIRLADDGETPNNPQFPLVIYRSAVQLSDSDPASVFEKLFAKNGWKNSWRNGIYDFLHFHTQTHEVLGIARGRVSVQFGGRKGPVVEVVAGDVVILPAGTGHQRKSASRDLLVVGAYPPGGGPRHVEPGKIDHDKAVAAIAQVEEPALNPVHGKAAPTFG